MSAIKPKDLENIENVYALVLAILYPTPLSAEEAFQKMGYPIGISKIKNSDIAMLRESGCSWGEIRELTGHKWPQSAYINYLRRKAKRAEGKTEN